MPRERPASIPSLPFTLLRRAEALQRRLPLEVTDAAASALRGGRTPTSQRMSPEKEAGLRSRLSVVYLDLEEANAMVERTKPLADRHALAFSTADTALREAIDDRNRTRDGRCLFALYNARVTAGHAWNPHRTRLNTAMSWRKALMEEAQWLNKEIGT